MGHSEVHVKARVAGSLPAKRSSLIGREREVAEVTSYLLHRPERLCTLTGMGGCGKTRLAVEVAAGVGSAFPGGVFLIELARIADPLLVPEVVASALSVAHRRNATVEDSLRQFLRSRVVLLVLDNCEHLVEACAHLADALLSSCPNLRILATSREPLKIAGERQWPVQPLALPPGEVASPEEVSRCPAVQLFVERAGAVRPSFRLDADNAGAVARICSLVGGLPLAIELAAARIGTLTPGQIEERLGDCLQLLKSFSRSEPLRRQTLKAALDWSYDLLTAAEQALFRRSAVFSGGWTVEAAEAVLGGDGLPPSEVLEVLARLVERSLVLIEEKGGEMRYRLLEPVRQYAEHLLAESGERETTQVRHASYFVALAEQAEFKLHRRGQAVWVRRLDQELDNVRAALHRAEGCGDAVTLLRLSGALYWYLWQSHRLREGLRWIEAALSPAGKSAPAALRGKALYGLAILLLMDSREAKAMASARRALARYREADDAEGLALATSLLSYMHMNSGDLVMAQALAEKSVAYAETSGSRWLVRALIVSADVLHRRGNAARALQLRERALALLRDSGDNWGVNYLEVALDSAQADVVRTAALSSIRDCWERADFDGLAAALEYLASRKVGDREKQVMLLAAASRLRQSLGFPPPSAERDVIDGCMASARAELGEARFNIAWAQGCALSIEEVVASALEEGRSGGNSKRVDLATLASAPVCPLSQRQQEVAKLIAQGYSNREIARALTITKGTAKLHVHQILRLLGLRSRFQVADWALGQDREKPGVD